MVGNPLAPGRNLKYHTATPASARTIRIGMIIPAIAPPERPPAGAGLGPGPGAGGVGLGAAPQRTISGYVMLSGTWSKHAVLEPTVVTVAPGASCCSCGILILYRTASLSK